MNGKNLQHIRQPGVFGQMTWDTYTVALFGFRTSRPHSDVIDALDAAALRLTSAFPFLAGQVVLENRTTSNSGTYRVAPYLPHAGKCLIIRKDCTTICPCFEEIAAARAPFSMLPSDVFSATEAMGYTYDYSKPRRVMVIQANLLRGGVVLCFSSHHNALDMNGQGQMIKYFAAACRGEDFDTKDVELGNKDEHHFLSLLRNGEKCLTHENMRCPSKLHPSSPHERALKEEERLESPQKQAEQETQAVEQASPQQKLSWRYCCFPHRSLKHLKSLASPNPHSSSAQQWVSTDDVMVAFYIQRLTALRLASPTSHVEANTPIIVSRAANGRSRLDPPAPPQYVGHMVVSSETDFPSARQLVNAPFSDVAAELRKSVNALDDHHVRSFATLLDKTEDKSTIFYGARHLPGQNFMNTSWAGLGLYQTSFGDVFGQGNEKPVFVRRPAFRVVPDLSYVMPKDVRGDVDIGICLAEQDWELLKGDEVWREFVEDIG